MFCKIPKIIVRIKKEVVRNGMDWFENSYFDCLKPFIAKQQ